MRHRQNSFGFTVVEGLLILAIVALIGAVGYQVYNTKTSTDKIAENTTAGSEQAAVSSDGVPSSVNNAQDLGQAESALNSYSSTSDDNQDFSQLDSELSAF